MSIHEELYLRFTGLEKRIKDLEDRYMSLLEVRVKEMKPVLESRRHSNGKR